MGNILFSHSYFYKYDPKQWNNKTPFPPLGTIYAAAMLRDLGYKVDLWDSNLEEDHRNIYSVLSANQPNFFVMYDDGFNYLTKMCLTNMRNAAFDMFKAAKENGATVIVCSSDSTDHYKEYHQEGADFVIHGEGEITLIELLQKLREEGSDWNSIEGISYSINDEIKVNKKRKNLKVLDELPLPAWDLIDVEKYRQVWQSGGKEFTLNIATTRGCPYRCNWCAKPIYGQRYNSRSPQHVIDEISFLQKNYNVKKFWMCDDIFGLKPKWVQEFNQLVQTHQLSFKYYIQSRVDLLLKEDTIDALAASGLDEVWVGAESGSQKILDAMDKDTTVKQIEEATNLLKKKGVKVCYFIQLGYLGETKDDIAETVGLIKRLKPHNIGVSVSYPLPGTPFYDKVKEQLKVKANWEDSDELAMMFQGTFNTTYYKILHRWIHQEFRMTKGMEAFRKLSFSKENLRAIALLPYYFIGSMRKKSRLRKMDNLAS